MSEPKRIALFGGTFNPLHNGHIDLALKVQNYFKIDKVVFIPSKIPPHKIKQNVISADIRYAMLKNTLKDYDGFEISKEEIERDGISYSIDTIKKMRAIYKNDALFLILGLDAFLEIDTWKDYKKTLSLISFIVIKRHYEDEQQSINSLEIENYIKSKISNDYKFIKGEDANSFEIENCIRNKISNGYKFIKKGNANSFKKIFIKDLKVKSISSSFIREQIKKNKMVELPISVIKLIKKYKLYGCQTVPQSVCEAF